MGQNDVDMDWNTDRGAENEPSKPRRRKLIHLQLQSNEQSECLTAVLLQTFHNHTQHIIRDVAVPFW